MIQVWPMVERFLTEHGAAVLVTIAQAQESSPREVGARMMVRPDGRFSGTIGGGALVIGSATKRARFAGTLRQIGMAGDDIDRLICPIGLTEIHDKAPAAIAAAIAAQLLIRREAVAETVEAAPRQVATAGASHA
jgi:xanthine/CO dehydrogenase XdhC/CoxF family maturation factor